MGSGTPQISRTKHTGSGQCPTSQERRHSRWTVRSSREIPHGRRGTKQVAQKCARDAVSRRLLVLSLTPLLGWVPHVHDRSLAHPSKRPLTLSSGSRGVAMVRCTRRRIFVSFLSPVVSACLQECGRGSRLCEVMKVSQGTAVPSEVRTGYFSMMCTRRCSSLVLGNTGADPRTEDAQSEATRAPSEQLSPWLRRGRPRFRWFADGATWLR